MSDLRDLYQELILEHNKRPRNFRVLEGANRKAEGFNPLCGDQVTVFLEVEDGIVSNSAFKGKGCAISTDSASLMTESVKGRRLEEVEALFSRFHDLVTGQAQVDDPAEYGKLAVFSSVSEYPARVKCATLSWHTLNAALKGDGEPVTTE